MGDHFQSLVGSGAARSAGASILQDVEQWLCAEEIISKELTDCVLDGTGHPPGLRFWAVCDCPPDDAISQTAHLEVNGVAATAGAAVAFDMEDAVRTCPQCAEDFDPTHAGPEWDEVVQRWTRSEADGFPPCPHCGYRQRIEAWSGPGWLTFGVFLLTFWNWPPLRESFIAAIHARTGLAIALREGKL